MRPVIAVDGIHLKGLYRGTMFVATCLDGNNQLYPLAIGVMDSENNDTWEWFMTKLHGVIGDTPAERMIVHPVAQYQFHILGTGIKEGIVDIREKTCSCKVFQLDQLVCAHAIAACITVHVDYISLCSKFYTKESLVMAYAQPVEPVGAWQIGRFLRKFEQ